MLQLRDQPLVDLSTSGVRHGLGLFETILVRQGRARRLAWHLERMADGAAFLGLDCPPTAEEVSRYVEARIGFSNLDSGVLRLFAYDDCLLATVTSTVPPPLSVATAGFTTRTRRLAGSPQCRFKMLSYVENVLLVREAETRGCLDLVASNERGNLADGGRTSLFVVIEGEVRTPPVEDGALPGVTRRALLEGGLAQEASLNPSNIGTWEAAFLTNALRGVVPLERFEDRILRPDHPLVREAARLEQADP